MESSKCFTLSGCHQWFDGLFIVSRQQHGEGEHQFSCAAREPGFSAGCGHCFLIATSYWFGQAHQCEQISSKPLWKDAWRWWEDSVYTWCSNHGKSCRSSLGSAGLGRSNQVNGIFSLFRASRWDVYFASAWCRQCYTWLPHVACGAWLKCKWCNYHTWFFWRRFTLCLKLYSLCSVPLGHRLPRPSCWTVTT